MISNNEREIIYYDKKIINILVKNQILLDGPFTSSAGIRIPIGAYLERVLAYPKDNRMLTKRIAKILKKYKIDGIFGCDMVGVPFGSNIAYEMKVPFCPIRKNKSNHGILTHLAGTMPNDSSNIALFDDWNAGWGTIRNFYKILREYKIKPKYIVTILETFENKQIRSSIKDFLIDHNLIFITFGTFKNILDKYLEKELLTKEAYPLIVDFIQNPEIYSQSDENINKYIELKNNHKTLINQNDKTDIEKRFSIV